MKSFNFLLPKRENKPRETGLTMALDKGLGYETAKSLMEISGEYVDFLKFGWGTIILHDREIIRKKVEMYKSFNITPYTGGTLFEIAYRNNKVLEFFEDAKLIGFKAVEISDGSTDIEHAKKLEFIAEAKEKDFMFYLKLVKKILMQMQLLT